MNSFSPLDPALIDQPLPPSLLQDGHSGYPLHLAVQDEPDVLRAVCGDAAGEFPESWWIEPKDWPDWARENDANKTWPMNFIDRYTNQTPTHECTCHSLTRAAEGVWNLQRGAIYTEGPKANFRYPQSSELDSVWFSPLSIYAEANPRQWGGANVRQVLEIACRRGFLPETMQPKDYRFKHAMVGTTGRGNNNQSRGSWVPLSRFPEGWQETAKYFKPLEVIFPSSWEQAVCIVLRSRFNCVGRRGHAIPWGQLIFEGKNLKAAAYPDSYDVTRFDSLSTIKSAWRGSFAIASMTMPDDWSKLAA